MNNNTVKNPKQQVPETIDLNDEDYLNCILDKEKNMSNNYSTVLNEISNNYLYKELFSIYKETKEMQRELFNMAFKKGWYELENAEQQKINEKYNTFDQKLQSIDQQ
jgi:spore coat protein CotF